MNSATQKSQYYLAVIIIAVSIVLSIFLSPAAIQRVSAQTTHTVYIANFAFVPQNLTINVGDTVMWNNTDPVLHILWFVFVANGSTYLLSDPISPGTTWNTTFNHAEALQYYSFDKLWMTGFVNMVQEVHDIAVVNITLSKTIVGQPYPTSINVTTINQGDFTEIFSLITYSNMTAIETKDIILASGSSTTAKFTWNTTAINLGKYLVQAYAEPVPGETNISDNDFTNGWIFLTILGDVNGDRKVDITDISLTIAAYGKTNASFGWNAPTWYANRDVNNDNKIDITDISMVIAHYGTSW